MNDRDPANTPPAGVSPRKWERLLGFLGALPPGAASGLFAALEAGDESGGGVDGAIKGGVSSRALLAILRRRMNNGEASFPPRARNARRIFFEPFEDFFVTARKGRKRRARIDRASLAPIWAIIKRDAACIDAAKAADNLDAALKAGAAVDDFENALFDATSEGLARLVNHAEEDAAFRADLSARVGSARDDTGAAREKSAAAALHDLAEIAMILPAHAQLKAAQAAFARPLPSLTEEDLFTARRIYAAAARAHPQAAPYVLYLIAARMSAPWRALRLAYHLAQTADGDLSCARVDATALAETLFDDLEALARGLERDADEDPDACEAPARFAHFSEFAAGMIAETTAAGDGASMSRVEACRDIAAAALARYAETALSALRRNHPTRHAGGSSRLMGLRPDINRAIDPTTEQEATRGAHFLSRASAIGEALERPDAAMAIVEDAIAEARRYAGDLILEIRAAEGADRVAARKRMEATLRALVGLLGDEERALLRERANVAAVSG